MIKLKQILSETKAWDKRKFGEPLPTLKSVMEDHNSCCDNCSDGKECCSVEEAVITEQMEKKLADAMTRYLIGDRKQAVRQLAMLASKINVEVDQDNYNSQYSDTHRAILRVLKRMM
mgnify:FL=1